MDKPNIELNYMSVSKQENSDEKAEPVEFKGRIVDRRQTILEYQNVEPNTDCIYKSHRYIDAEALMLQVKLSDEKKTDKDLEDPIVVEYVNNYIDSRHARKKLGKNKNITLQRKWKNCSFPCMLN